MSQDPHPPGPGPEAPALPGDLLASLGAGAGDVADRVLAALLGSQELHALYAGDRLGWYRSLAEHGASTAEELARRTGTDARYTREWLEHQAAVGYLTVEATPVAAPGAEPAAEADARRFALTPGAQEVLTDMASLAYLAPFGRLAAASWRVIDETVEAYRTGTGVSWARLGADAREAQAALNRPFFLRQLAQEVVPQLPALAALLADGARVADIGCGEGWSSIAFALGFPTARVDGIDLDGPSVAAAHGHARQAGVGDRVRFVEADAAGYADAGPGHAGAYDVVTAFECVHDLRDPVGVLRGMRALADPQGYVLVVDERTEPAFSAPAGVAERLFYGYSLTVCLPDALAEAPSAGTGTVMRPDVLAGYAHAAGFDDVEVLGVEHDTFRFYRLVL
ncbi:class I SAM-dependent methyltransferase [Cellulomonas cellasea]|uniref:class I SAM-dependent methyltransferase n=1 Tax=Cellulomonas cellasea TaxID=43670 RepID=UPI0025A3E748|nr:class I SAM-dependent methyltransferase [Cellulomonas cellasea]MDM8086011.1 class I SAM-dependent methyltransferase [Cellulomonas cellasea]